MGKQNYVEKARLQYIYIYIYFVELKIFKK
jgi:hypothetical protein